MDITNIQLQIKAFNKALSRADKAGTLSDDIYAAISDLIDPERMTKSGLGKAGKKYLENMSPEELLAYSSDIGDAKKLLEIDSLSFKLDLDGVKDPQGLLWRMYQKLEDAGYAFDSEQVRAVADGTVSVNFKSFALHMNKYLHDPEYGLTDFNEWFDSQVALD